MAYRYAITYRPWGLPSLRKIRLALGLNFAPEKPGQVRQSTLVVVRRTFIQTSRGRKQALLLGGLIASRSNKNVLLYRKLQPAGHLAYPIFTPWKRRVKALGQKVAPIIPVGGGGSNIDLQHYLGLCLIKLGGTRF